MNRYIDRKVSPTPEQNNGFFDRYTYIYIYKCLQMNRYIDTKVNPTPEQNNGFSTGIHIWISAFKSIDMKIRR